MEKKRKRARQKRGLLFCCPLILLVVHAWIGPVLLPCVDSAFYLFCFLLKNINHKSVKCTCFFG